LWLISAFAGLPVFNASRPSAHHAQLHVEGDEFTNHGTIIAAIAPQGRWRPRAAVSVHRDHVSKEWLPVSAVEPWHGTSTRRHDRHWQIGQEHDESEHEKGSVLPPADQLHRGGSLVSSATVEQQRAVAPRVADLMPSSALQIEEVTATVSAGGSHAAGCQDTHQPPAALMAAGPLCHIDCSCALLGGLCLSQQRCALLLFFIVVVGFSCAIVAVTWCSPKRARSSTAHTPELNCPIPAPVPAPPEAAPPDRPVCRTLAEQAAFPVFRGGSTSRRENAKGAADSISAGG